MESGSPAQGSAFCSKIQWNSENQACVGALLSSLPVVWILSSTCRICCIFMWEESSTDNAMHLFHSLKQKTRISKFYTCYFNFIFEFAQLLHPSPQNVWDTTFTGDPNSSSISCGDLIWFYSPKTGRIQKEIPIYWRYFLFQTFPYAIVLDQSPLPLYSLVLT